MSDVKDILEIEQASTGTPTKEAIVAGNKVKYQNTERLKHRRQTHRQRKKNLVQTTVF
jgi:hypothetical protein